MKSLVRRITAPLPRLMLSTNRELSYLALSAVVTIPFVLAWLVLIVVASLIKVSNGLAQQNRICC